MILRPHIAEQVLGFVFVAALIYLSWIWRIAA